MPDDRMEKARQRIGRMDDFVLEDLSSISDEDLMKEAIEDGIDLDAVGKAGIAALERAKLAVGKRRMESVRREMKLDAKRPALRPVRGATQANLRDILARNRQASSKLTMAARNEAGSVEDDAEGIMADFMELGAIPGEAEGDS